MQQPLKNKIERFVFFLNMLEASAQCDGEELEDSTVVCSFTSNGTSDSLTAADFRQLRAAYHTEIFREMPYES